MSNKITFFEVVVGYLNYSKIFEFCKHTILLSSGGMLSLYFSSEKEEKVRLVFLMRTVISFLVFRIRIQTNGMVCYAWKIKICVMFMLLQCIHVIGNYLQRVDYIQFVS